MRIIKFTLLLTLCCSASATAEIYRWRDDAGNVVFSDTPKPGAEVVKLSEPTIVPGGKPRVTEKRRPANTAIPYESITITSPTDEATIRENVANVSVSIRVLPRLQTRFGHKVQLLFNGQGVAEPGTSMSFTLANVDRGAHSVQAVIVDSDGNNILSSSTVQFFVHKASVNAPAR